MTEQMTVMEMRRFACRIRMEVVKMISKVPAGHLGGSMSIADTLAVLYGGKLDHDPSNPKWEKRDWLVMSKGHCGPALYAALALRGFFPMEMLDTLNKPGTDLPSHCDRNHTPGVDMTTGSLGQGASTAAGVAMSLKMDHLPNQVFLIMGDGEIQEGQVWEMAMQAATRNLDNLIAFVDYNKLQIDGRTDTKDICCLGDLGAKFRAFGWYTQEIDGHDVIAISTAVDNAIVHTGSPSMIILNTVKGKGWSKMENQVGSHSCSISPEDLEEALGELQAEMDRIGEVERHE